MKVGVVSDTHGNLDGLRQAIRALMSEDVRLFIHLGDDYEDTEVFDEFPIDSVMKVPGVYDPEYSDRMIPHRSTEDISGWRVMVSHTPVSHSNDFPEDLKPEELCARREIDVLLYGHTHTPDISEREGILHFNPGHLKPEDKKGYPPSFGILEFTPEQVDARILGLTEKQEILRTRLQRSNG
jgi:putative phosphoesterase